MPAGQRDPIGTVYRPRRKYTTFLGVRGKYWPRVFIALAIGTALFLGLGVVTVTVDEPLNTAARASALAELEKLQDAVVKRDRLAEASGTNDDSKLDLTDEERAAVAEASAKGITASTTKEQLDALVPKTQEAEKERFPMLARLALCIVIPGLSAFAWHLDMRGWCLDSETSRLRRYAKRQKFYLFGARRSDVEEA